MIAGKHTLCVIDGISSICGWLAEERNWISIPQVAEETTRKTSLYLILAQFKTELFCAGTLKWKIKVKVKVTK